MEKTDLKSYSPFSAAGYLVFEQEINRSLVRNPGSNSDCPLGFNYRSAVSSSLKEAIGNSKLDHSLGNLGFRVNGKGTSSIPKNNKTDLKKNHPNRMLRDPSISIKFKEADIQFCTNKEVLNLATENKQVALCLQTFISECSETALQRMCLLAFFNLKYLIVHPFGNYAIQRLVARDPRFAESLIFICKENFDFLAKNEYSSRVLECLIQHHSEFRRYAVKQFQRKFLEYLLCRSSAFLISTVIKESLMRREVFFDFTQQKNLKFWLSKKHFKRVFITFVENAEQSLAEILFNRLIKIFAPFDLMKDRLYCLLLVAFAVKGITKVFQLVIRGFTTQPFAIMKDTAIVFLIQQLKETNQHGLLKADVGRSLYEISRFEMVKIHQHPIAYKNYVLCYQLLKTKVD